VLEIILALSQHDDLFPYKKNTARPVVKVDLPGEQEELSEIGERRQSKESGY